MTMMEMMDLYQVTSQHDVVLYFLKTKYMWCYLRHHLISERELETEGDGDVNSKEVATCAMSIAFSCIGLM